MSDMMTQEEAMAMSNEQAVQILIPMRNMMCDQHGCPISDAVFALYKAIEALSVDRPSEIIYGNEHNCIMTIFGECSYAETGCGDCAVVEKVRKALSADRPTVDKDYLMQLIQEAVYDGEACAKLLDLVDRPQGEWIPCTKKGLPLTELGRRERQKWYGYKCSNCNFVYKGNALTESPFCQNCGAHMKGSDDEV